MDCHFYPWSWNRFQRLFRSHFLHGVIVFLLIFSHEHFETAPGFLFLFVEVVDDHSDKQIESEEWTEYNEEHKVKVHVYVSFSNRLTSHLKRNIQLQTKMHFLIKFSARRWIWNQLTSLESIASFIIWIQPLNVATWKRHKYALPTWSKFIGEFSHV